MTDPSAAIRTSDLHRRFGDKEAVAGVDLSVDRGEIYGFLGPNGAGKSTTLRMLCTLLAPTSGVAMVAGHDVVRDPIEVRVRIGVALQDASLDESQTGRELLMLQGRLYGLGGGSLSDRIRSLEGLVDIGADLDQPIKTYSGGMKRRLDLAASLVHDPEVLFLDEPTTGLDPVSRVRVWDEVRRLNASGMTILLTTQYLEEADELADRVGIIDRGRIVGEGTPIELKRSIGQDVIIARIDGDADLARTSLSHIVDGDAVSIHGEELTVRTENGDATIGPVAVALHGCGVTVQSLTLRTPTLDDVFLEMTGAHLSEGSEVGEVE